MRAISYVLCALCMIGAPLVHSKISVVHLDELIQSSDLIVIATVTQVTESTSGSATARHANVMVRKTLKGKTLRHLQFMASSDFEDSSVDAVVGETVLLFLNGRAGDEYGVALVGRGRMPLRQVKGKTYATLWSDVVLPKGAPVIPGPDPRYSFITSVELSYIEKLVKNHKPLKAQPNYAFDPSVKDSRWRAAAAIACEYCPPAVRCRACLAAAQRER